MMIRWLIEPPADGATNMARDEAILTAVGNGESPVTLRFYRWDPPTISLGYFQRHEDYLALPAPAGELAVVRRQTGGGAILHDLEWTYSLTVPNNHVWLGANPSALYSRVQEAVSNLLMALGIDVQRGPADAGTCSREGPFFCFERHSCFDLLVGGTKIMGSAQRRTRYAVLQHGSLICDSRYPQQQCSTILSERGISIEAHLTRLAEAIVGEPLDNPAMLTENECRLADEIRGKYASDEWTRKR